MRRVLPALLLLLLAGAPVPVARAAGITTHAWMAEEGIEHVDSPELKALLDAQRPALLSGAVYPDSGYAASSYPGGDYGEISHWERFTNAYAAHIRSRPECAASLEDPDGPCAALIAHMMGTAAHGVGDEMWDWMFEPQMADHGEDPGERHRVDDTPGWAEISAFPAAGLLTGSILDLEAAVLEPGNGFIGTPEYAMDVIAIADHGRVAFSPTPPPTEDLLAVYAAVGRNDITRDGILAGHAIITAAQSAERLSVVEAHSVRADLPYTSAHMHDESGGVFDVGEGAAAYYEALWAKLHGNHPVPALAAVHPEDGETGVPVIWQPPRTSPGPYGGGAQQRIIAVLTNSLDPTTVNATTFRLFDGADTPVAPLDGFPRPGPYGPGDGTHSMLFYPAADLRSCERYTAVVTTGVRDHAGVAPPRPYSWSFRTGSGGPEACPPPPGDIPPDDPPAGDPPPGAEAPCGRPLDGTRQAERLLGTALGDRILGGGGDDTIQALGGEDCAYGDGGKDRIYDGPGADRVWGGRGADRLRGGMGRDALRAGAGADRIHSVSRGRDRVHCGPGRDVVLAGFFDVLRGCEVVSRR